MTNVTEPNFSDAIPYIPAIKTSLPKLSWNAAKEMLGGQWVEIVECQWHIHSHTYPRWIRVRHIAETREELMESIASSEAIGEGCDNAIVLQVTGSSTIIEYGATII